MLASKRKSRPRIHLASVPIATGIAALAMAICVTSALADDDKTGEEPARQAIDTAGFRDGAHHWRAIRDANRIIQPLPGQKAFSPSQVAEIVRNILLFQRENGGWPKDYDLLAILTPEQIAAVQATRSRTDTSFDNHNIHTQVEYLARAYTMAGVEAWREACLRGFDFMLAAQLANGGFPQRYPQASGYAAQITFNDGVMIGILNVLEDAAEGPSPWSWLDTTRRDAARQAVARGIECILNCQIRTAATGTGWCQQHDAKTLGPVSARTFELASCCPQETTEIVRFLMRADEPDERIVLAHDPAPPSIGSAARNFRRRHASAACLARRNTSSDTMPISMWSWWSMPNAPRGWASALGEAGD